MRKHLTILLPALVVAGCILGGPAPTRSAATVPATAEMPDDPDDASPLATLMRRMADHVDSVKAHLAHGRELPPRPTGVDSLFTAPPTPGMHIDPITYPTFGQDYLAKLNGLYAALPADRTRAFNALVQSCANCHTTHCPGPLMRIRKMYAPVE
ncbi:MAG: hypothetical protein RBT71_01855 [Flavobacteriales bacterium]|jgi:hypothetical protein|nr:hypothetical protein [Flavobacteriales bacterium]